MVQKSVQLTFAGLDLVVEELHVIGDNNSVGASGTYFFCHSFHLGCMLIIQHDQNDGRSWR